MRFLSDILSSAYSPESLRKCIRPEDPYKFRLGGTDLGILTSVASSALYETNFSIGGLNCVNKNGKNIYSPTTYPELLAFRRTNQILARCVRHLPSNRDAEIKAVKQVLASETTASVFRCDVKSFFESISFKDVIGQLIREGLRSSCCINHLKNLADFLESHYNHKSLPRGLALSSTLADFMLYDFDLALSNLEGVALYSRYVDDMLLVHFLDDGKIKDIVEQHLSKLGLRLNGDKTQESTPTAKRAITYLGYKFTQPSGGTPLGIGISQNKIKKIKTRIALTFNEFVNNRDFDLLVARIQFITFTTRLKKFGRTKPLYTGLSHTYKHSTVMERQRDLRELDDFYFGILKSRRYHLSKRIASMLNNTQLNTLHKMSFSVADKKKITTTTPPDEIKVIREAWIHAS